MADQTIVDALEATDLFAGLSAKALNRVAGVARLVNHAEGKAIAAEGDDGMGLHIITQGTVSVTVHGESRPSMTVGDYFGEVSLIDGKPRSATVVADSPVTTVSIVSWQFKPVLDSEPEVSKAMLMTLCTRLRNSEKA